jgi:hypothetical protein
MRLALQGPGGVSMKSIIEIFRGSSWVEIVVASAGGSSGHALNPDYAKAVDLMLERMAAADVIVIAIVLNSRPMSRIAIGQRILAIDLAPYPLRLSAHPDLSSLRKAITRAASRHQSLSAKGGNPRRRISFIVVPPTQAMLDECSIAKVLDAIPVP